MFRYQMLMIRSLSECALQLLFDISSITQNALELYMIQCDIRTYDLRAVRRKVDKLTAELGKAKVKIAKASLL